MRLRYWEGAAGMFVLLWRRSSSGPATVPEFIQITLGQLEAAMAGQNWLAGNSSVRELVERLEQVGVKVSVEETM